ncbi:hypothetical protein [Roseimarinus sediminis]|uniref:hypothetical protein n=1 Tax=Roseimarinus sediminis TaxID=1610899 RepID=UPI003D236656
MAEKKPHLYFRNPREGLVVYKLRIGGGKSNRDEDQYFELDNQQFNIFNKQNNNMKN